MLYSLAKLNAKYDVILQICNSLKVEHVVLTIHSTYKALETTFQTLKTSVTAWHK